jgi:hypothetical protein
VHVPMHVPIIGNLIGAFVNATVDGPWIVLRSSMTIYASVVCGQPEFVGEGTDVIANPAAIVEVLSDANELFERGEKFRGYRAVPSMIDYLLAHDRVRVEHYTRGRDDT